MPLDIKGIASLYPKDEKNADSRFRHYIKINVKPKPNRLTLAEAKARVAAIVRTIDSTTASADTDNSNPCKSPRLTFAGSE